MSTLDFSALLADPTAFWPHGQPPGYRRARALGGGSAVNGMLASAPDSGDLAAWEIAAQSPAGSARSALERVIADVAPQVSVPGAVGRALGAAGLGAGHRLGGSTLDVDATGVLAAALSARSGVRRDAVAVHLDGAPDNLEVRSGTAVGAVRVGASGPTVITDDGSVAFDHVVCSAGALGTPALVSDLLVSDLLVSDLLVSDLVGPDPVVSARRARPGVNHVAVPITVLLEPEHRSVTDVPAVSRVVRWATGIGDERIDAQVVALDHLGWTPDGRALGLLIVTILAVDEPPGRTSTGGARPCLGVAGRPGPGRPGAARAGVGVGRTRRRRRVSRPMGPSGPTPPCTISPGRSRSDPTSARPDCSPGATT